MIKNVINVVDIGADPSGKSDCTEAFRTALEGAVHVKVPTGIYRISGMIKGREPEAKTPPTGVTAEDTSREE